MSLPRQWSVDWTVGSAKCPPDPMGGVTLYASICWSRYPGAPFTCTRPKEHTGRHAASNGLYILAVWP